MAHKGRILRGGQFSREMVRSQMARAPKPKATQTSKPSPSVQLASTSDAPRSVSATLSDADMNIWEHDVEQRRYIAKFRRTYLVQHKPDMETHRSSLRRLAPRHERND